MVSPPIVVSPTRINIVAYHNVLCTHLRQYVFALLHQAYCSMVLVGSPFVGEPADRVTVSICVMRIEIYIIHERRQVWGECRRANPYLCWKVLFCWVALNALPILPFGFAELGPLTPP